MIWKRFAALERVTAPDCCHPATSPRGSQWAASRNSVSEAGGSMAVIDGGALPSSDGPPASWARTEGLAGIGGGVASVARRLQPQAFIERSTKNAFDTTK